LEELHKGSKPKTSFNKILLAAIDKALSSLGENVKTAIYFHLEETFNIKRWEIPLRINDFSNALEKIFGIGARHIEILVMKNLYAKNGFTCEWPTLEWPMCKWIIPEVTFQECVDLMRRNFENTYKKEKMEVPIVVYEEECI
jgi:hypothetical protein